ncbi:MAG: phosphohydrolase [Flavobacteriales bacterium]|nr:phosphohydrolase [Flavobacteriales bacterium]|tara:strand:- start:18419 stop:20524 length:2106 start_codon:yes stop_codon:yes gene_type:complete
MKKVLSKIRNNHERIFRFFLFVATLVIILFSYPRQVKFKYEFTKGKPWMHESIISPFDFSVLKSDNEINKEKEIIESQHLPVFNYSNEIFQIKAEEFVNTFEKKWSEKKGVKRDNRFTFSILFKNKNKLARNKKNDLVNFGYNFLQDIYSKGIIQYNNQYSSDENIEVLLKSESVAERRSINEFYTVNSAANKINLINKLSDDDFEFLVPLLLSSLEQNIVYDRVASNELLSSELQNISLTKGLIISGQVIVNKGELVNSDKYQVLLSLKHKYEGIKWDTGSYFLVLFGQFILLGLSLLILWLFLKQYRSEVLDNTTKISMILSLILIMVLVSNLVISYALDWVYLIPFCVSPIILKAFFDNRVALFVHLITILIIGFIMPNGFEFVFLQLIAGIVSILTVLKMYKRAQLFMSVAKVIGVYLLVYIALSFIHDGSFRGIEDVKLLQFAISGALTLFAYPIIFIFEKVFSLVSDVSLLELTDTNSKLLRRLSEEAPGTFQHSLQVANLAEMGALEVNANALLTRAGAIYHDIGKLRNPMYFIENQSSNINPHDDIKFHESAEIIINHVLIGIDIAKENNLPDELIDFIRTHHGTSTVQYFYKQYITDFPEEDFDIKDFTYPGPKPFSKETAILMMADSCEAASRSLKNPTSENIDVLIEKVINKQINDNQFVNAPITLKEITQLKKLFKNKLGNIHHARVEY